MPQVLYVILMIAYLITVIGIIVVVVSENRNPLKSLAWVTVLLFLPLVGIVLYIFFGRNLKSRQLISRRNKRKLLNKEDFKQIDINSLPLSDESKQEIKLAKSLTGAIYFPGNQIDIFTDGGSKFKALLNDIDNATTFINLQYYIFENDKIGCTIAEHLIAKAKTGVHVRVIYDHVGSLKTRNRFFRRMKEAGVDVHPFFRVTFPQLANRINWRNHRKIVVIDNRVGYIGGMNIADRYAGSDGKSGWRDTHFRVEGDIVSSLTYSFAVDWQFLKTPDDKLDIEPAVSETVNDCGVQFVSGGPVNNFDNMSLCFLKAISSARKSIYIQTPYFLPTDALLHALEAAALSKVDVRIMLPRHSDSAMLRFASFSYITQCLRSNIKVYLYEPGMLHAKTMIIDEDFVTAGSTNFDFRSFENNFECNLLIYDREVNAAMRDIFFNDMKECKKLTFSVWKKRPLWARTTESVVRLFSPIL